MGRRLEDEGDLPSALKPLLLVREQGRIGRRMSMSTGDDDDRTGRVIRDGPSMLPRRGILVNKILVEGDTTSSP